MVRYLPLLAILSLAACGGSPPPVVTYKPLDYSYLPPIMLKVANVTVQNNYVPDSGAANLLGEDPEPPANAVMDMANHRLIANGTPGNATFTVETASIEMVGNNLTGILTVRLDVASGDGKAHGYTEASVNYAATAPDASNQGDMQAALYDITKHLMDAMNVQFQYQLQHNLGDWISYSSNAAPVPVVSGVLSGGIQAAPLTAPMTAPGVTPTAAPPVPTAPMSPLTPGQHSLNSELH
jgi:hypothetical protein